METTSPATMKKANNARVEELQLLEAQPLMPTTSKSQPRHLISRMRPAMHLGLTTVPQSTAKSSIHPHSDSHLSTNGTVNEPSRFLTMLEPDPVKWSTETLPPETAMKKVADRLRDSHRVEPSTLLLPVSLSHSFQRRRLLRRLKPTTTEKATPVSTPLRLSMRPPLI